jgi:hypothetical protein
MTISWRCVSLDPIHNIPNPYCTNHHLAVQPPYLVLLSLPALQALNTVDGKQSYVLVDLIKFLGCELIDTLEFFEEGEGARLGGWTLASSDDDVKTCNQAAERVGGADPCRGECGKMPLRWLLEVAQAFLQGSCCLGAPDT